MIPLTNNSSATTQTLTLTLGGSASTTYPTATVYSYIIPPQAKPDFSEYRSSPEFVLLTAATKTIIGATPPPGSVKMITGVSIPNPDTVSMTMMVDIDDGMTRRQWKGTLLTGEAVYYGNGKWYCLDASGNLKESLSAATNWGVTGNLTVGGNTTLGDAAADSLTINAGIVSAPNVPAFLAFATSQTNVTGDNTTYTVTFATEIYDQQSNFSSATFTAPYTGRYDFSCFITFTDVTTSFTRLAVILVTSNRSYQFQQAAAAPDGSTAQVNGGSVTGADMDAGDTAIIQVLGTGSTKTIDINVNSFFSGAIRSI